MQQVAGNVSNPKAVMHMALGCCSLSRPMHSHTDNTLLQDYYCTACLMQQL